MKPIFLSVTILTLIALSACSALTPAGASLDGTAWRLSSYAGQPALPETNVTIQFEDGRAGGEAGCNGYGASYKVDGNRIRFEEIASTLMLCTAPEGVMEQEAEFLGSLEQVERFELDEDQLRLIRSDGEALVFVPQ